MKIQNPPQVSERELKSFITVKAVVEVVIAEAERKAYQVEVDLNLKPGRAVLHVTRGKVRRFRTLDAVARFLKVDVSIGETPVRLELKG